MVDGWKREGGGEFRHWDGDRARVGERRKEGVRGREKGNEGLR